MKPNLKDQVQTAIDMFKRTNRLHMRVFDKYIDTLEVRRRQHHILRYLYIKDNQNTTVCQKAIADNFEISTAAVTVSLKKLESMGLVQKTVDKNDSRFNSVSITKKGKAVIERTREVFWNIDSAMFEDLTEQELIVFTSCLEKMHTRLKTIYESENE